MLEGCTPFPEAFAERYRRQGYWLGLTLGQGLDKAVVEFAEREALSHGAERYTYAELRDTVDRLAYQLAGLGLAPRDRVVMQLPNIPEFVFVFYALQKIGVIPVMALRPHRHNEIRHFLSHSGAVGYIGPDAIGDFDYREMAAEMQAENANLEHVIVAGEAGPGQISIKELLDRPVGDDVAELLTARQPDPGEVALMLLSGGTTALPKLIPRTHEDYFCYLRLCCSRAEISSRSVYLALLPMGHNFPLGSPGLLGTLWTGGRMVLAPDLEPETFFSLIESEGVTITAVTPPLVSGWLRSEAREKYDLRSFEVLQCGGARLLPELRRQVRELLGCFYQEAYGTAEGLGHLVPFGAAEEQVLESSGLPLAADDEIRVVDDEGNEVPEGQSGELLGRGPYTIHGYYNNAEANAAAFTAEGFYRMGDVVKRLGAYVYTEGRKKDLINRGGEKISCDEIEDLILDNPKIENVVLVAMPDEVYGEKACAFVTLHAGQDLDLAELVEFLMTKQIAKFKLPERLEVVDSYPMSPVGKILRNVLRDRIADKLAAEGSGDAGA
ncbi:MAG TPA: AMP-binding protein [Alphaproteobacteria bacterium]|jgi:2,3-dihydroxybenzoate-AMP ligase|nr:AMP-binding protein [Alphaproteobacteria bacterium]MDP6271836.1 AMP-binding protein [Alphaproteobacteria bacterium]MDP7165170.1 AMP-binding protein [Alphaproteobacteria bacterium]MDP7429756.1 AMP-binding protein [Alphaproteobacteria bacterium]HJM51189.1 AMP-binding protein [Alphaproteobacteria bacterium]